MQRTLIQIAKSGKSTQFYYDKHPVIKPPHPGTKNTKVSFFPKWGIFFQEVNEVAWFKSEDKAKKEYERVISALETGKTNTILIRSERYI